MIGGREALVMGLVAVCAASACKQSSPGDAGAAALGSSGGAAHASADANAGTAGNDASIAESAPRRAVPIVKAQCTGPDLDLDVAFTDFACLGESVGPPPGLEVAVMTATTTVVPGANIELTITFTNTTDAPASYGMMTMPGFDLFPLETKDAAGSPVLPAYPCSTRPHGNTAAPMLVVLPAHGKGHIKRTWSATRSSGKCDGSVPLDSGTYSVSPSLDPGVRVKPLAVRVPR